MSFPNENSKNNSKASNKQNNILLDTVLKDSSNKKRKIPLSNTKLKITCQSQNFIISKGKNSNLNNKI